MLDVLLPVHPHTGLTAVGVLPSGRPVWPVLGGAGDGTDDADDAAQDGDAGDDADGTDDADEDGTDGDADGDSAAGARDDSQGTGSDKAHLAEAGRKALAAEREARRKADKDRRAAEKARREAETARKAAEDRQAEMQAQLARLAGGGDSSDDAAAAAAAANEEKIRREADEAATKRYSERVLRSEIRVAAAGKMNDPADALRLLDLSQFEAGDDGEFDQDEIAAAIEDLVKDKPYLAAPAATAGRFQGTGDGGARERPRKKGQLTRAELQRMKPAEITKAKAEGRLDDLLAGKS